MTQHPNGAAGNGAVTDAVRLRAEIRQTRADLGETLQLLAAKTDVKARVRESASHTAERVRRNPLPLVAVLAGAAALAAVVVLARRRWS